MDITAKSITDAYARLKFWIEDAAVDRQQLAEIQAKIKEVDAIIWPDAKNDAERKAAKMNATAELRQQEQEQAAHYARTETELTLARLALDEIHDIMRLYELAEK